MSVNWDQLGQLQFDRTVEMLVRHRYGEKVRAVNGRGGDAGVDIEVTLDDGRLWILQLKYFPDGFSSQWRKRRSEIRGSFVTAMQHQPDKWTLVVPCLCTTPEHRWVQRLKGREELPEIEVIDRDDLGCLDRRCAIDRCVGASHGDHRDGAPGRDLQHGTSGPARCTRRGRC